jgi:proline iminopeptidase
VPPAADRFVSIATLDHRATLAIYSSGSGPTVVALHGGLGLDSTYLRRSLAPLSDTNRLVALDMRGHGCSTGRDSLDDQPRDILIEDVHAVMSSLGDEPIVLFGHSYGGFVALEYAIRHPERVRALALCATSASTVHFGQMLDAVRTRARPAELEALERALSGPVASDDEFAETWRAITPLYFHDGDPAQMRHFDDTVYSAAGYNAGTRWLADYDVRACLSLLEMPVLLVHGADDWLMPTHIAGNELASGLPNATQLSIERSGHYPFIERPEQFFLGLRGWLATLRTADSSHRTCAS